MPRLRKREPARTPHVPYTTAAPDLHTGSLGWTKVQVGGCTQRCGLPSVWGPLVNIGIMFLDCPAYLDPAGRARCGLPAYVRCRYIMDSTDGPLESIAIRCPVGHIFNGPVEFLTFGMHPPAATPRGTGRYRGRLPGRARGLD